MKILFYFINLDFYFHFSDLFIKWEVGDVNVTGRCEDTSRFPMDLSIVRNQHADLFKFLYHVIGTGNQREE